MVINKLFISTSQRYRTPQIRSYTLNTTYDALNNIHDLVSRGSRRNLDPLNLSRVVPGVIGLSRIGINANIPYGWQQERLRFMMEVISDHALGKLFTYIQGYSDYYDASMSGHIDPNITLFINSVTEVLYFIDPNTGKDNFRILKAYNVFNNNYSSYDNYDMDRLRVIRPLDVISNLDMLQVKEEDGYFIDTTSNFKDVKTSRRINNDPMRYLSKVLDSHIQSRDLSSVGYSNRDLTSNAMALAAEDSLISNPFLATIHDMTGEINPTSFTIGFLDSLDRTLLTDPRRTTMLRISENGHRLSTLRLPTSVDSLTTNDTADFTQPSMEAVLAQEILGSIIDTMSSNFITEIVLSMTNDTVDMVPAVIPYSVSCFIDKAYSIEIEFCNRLITYIESVLMPKLTQNNNILLNCTLAISLNTDSTVNISINGQPEMIFRFPTFADSTYAPVISDKINQDNIVGDFENLISAIGVSDGSVVDNLYNFN